MWFKEKFHYAFDRAINTIIKKSIMRFMRLLNLINFFFFLVQRVGHVRHNIFSTFIAENALFCLWIANAQKREGKAYFFKMLFSYHSFVFHLESWRVYMGYLPIISLLLLHIPWKNCSTYLFIKEVIKAHNYLPIMLWSLQCKWTVCSSFVSMAVIMINTEISLKKTPTLICNI